VNTGTSYGTAAELLARLAVEIPDEHTERLCAKARAADCRVGPKG
jgi:hypothetical protein